MTPGTTSDAVEYAPHPEALMMSELSEQAFEKLKAGIQLHGLQHPLLILKGTRYLLDGRHRLRACQELNLPLRVAEVEIPDGSTVAIYTATFAAKRPGLTPTEKALLAVELLPEYEKRAADRKYLGLTIRYGEKGKATALAAALVGVSPSYVQLAVRLKKQHPNLFERVRLGELDLVEAKGEAEGKAPRSKSKKPKNDDEYRVPNRLRDRLTAAMDEVGGDSLRPCSKRRLIAGGGASCSSGPVIASTTSAWTWRRMRARATRP